MGSTSPDLAKWGSIVEKKNSRCFQKAKLGYALSPATIYVAFRLYVKSKLEMISSVQKFVYG